MTSHSRKHLPQASADAVPMLCWVFRRGTATMTCEVDAAAGHHFDVCVVPHWNLAAASIERFDDPISALERHAEIVRRLRQIGWTVTDHRPTNQGGPRRTPTLLAA